MRHIGVLCVLVLVSVASLADAEPRRTTEAVVLRKKPGEKEPVVAKIPANTEVKVLAEQGRWLKVRVNGVEGYLTRTTVTDPEAPELAPTGAWSAEMTSPTALLGSAPNPDASKIGEVAAEASFTRAAPPTIAIRAELGLGYRALGMDLTSNAEGGLTNYLVDADAVAVVLDVDATMRLSGRAFVAADLRTSFSDSSPGIDYPGPTAPPGKIPFTTVATDLGVRAGIRLKDAFDLALRAGGHYDAFLTQTVDNAGMLPRERLLGVTLGVRADIAPPHTRFGATARFDVLAVGSRAQTPGLEDGQGSTAHALWGGLTLRYFASRHASPFVAYELGRATTAWTGMSVREPAVTNAHRVDTAQVIQIGISAEL
jgi:hypothetical protein